MTQRIDWEALGKAAGEAEKNGTPGIKQKRPEGWRPGSRYTPVALRPPTAEQLERAHRRTMRGHASQALARKLDAVLGTETDE
jgi:hypothetical protein